MFPSQHIRIVLISLVAGVLLVAGCGGDDDSAEPDAGDTTTTQAESAGDAGGEDTGDDASDDDASDDDASDDDDDGDGDVDDVIDDLDFGDGLAVVTIGETTYEFGLGGNSSVGGTTYIGVCQELFGLINASGYDTEGRAITVEMEIPPVDWDTYEDERFDPPRIEVEDDENDRAWVADVTESENDPALAGASQVDEWTTDGTRASGTATFIEMTAFGSPVEGAEPVQGSFQVGCANE